MNSGMTHRSTDIQLPRIGNGHSRHDPEGARLNQLDTTHEQPDPTRILLHRNEPSRHTGATRGLRHPWRLAGTESEIQMQSHISGVSI